MLAVSSEPTFTLVVNHACNLRCYYCYTGEKFSRPMSLATAKKAVDMLCAATTGKGFLSFFGGEPLLEFELIKETVSYKRSLEEKFGKVLQPRVITNATLLTDERIDYLSENGFHLGVSIDGVREAHEANRPYPSGRSSFDDVFTSLQKVVKRFPAVTSASVVTPRSVSYLADSVRMLLDLGVRYVRLQINHFEDWSDENLDLLEAQMMAVGDTVVERYRRGGEPIVDRIEDKIVTHLRGCKRRKDPCPFGAGEVAVAPSGNLYPCDRLVGEDNNEDLRIGTLESGIEIKKVLALRAMKNAPKPECEGCAYAERCMNICGCANYELTGSIGQVGGLLCRWQQICIRAADRAGETLFAEKNPAFLHRFYER